MRLIASVCVSVLACSPWSGVARAELASPIVEEALLAAVNSAREDPPAVARALRRYRATLRGLIAYGPRRHEGMRTVEGAAAVDEAIAFLERQPPMPPLAASAVLGRAARTHMAEQARTGVVGHRSRDGRGPAGRVRAAGGGEAVGETIAYGYSDPATVVRQLIVDDGVPDRGHRSLVFSRQFQFAGASCATHPRYRHACTINFAPTADARWRRPEQLASR